MHQEIDVPEAASLTEAKYEMRQYTKLVTLQLLRAYKWAISPMFPLACRYVPTCSEYAMEAVERYGVLRGGMKAVLRLLRCHPFVRGGYDPVVKRRMHCAGAAADESRQHLPASYNGTI